MSKTDLRARTI
jgi:hypothetical protein